ncbi:hypothetical protein AB6D02_11275, partial [Vibrio splendidus]
TNYRFCFQFPLICEEPFFINNMNEPGIILERSLIEAISHFEITSVSLIQQKLYSIQSVTHRANHLKE